MVTTYLILLLFGLCSTCLLSDGSQAAPFYVNSEEVTPASGDSCSPFPSLAAALLAAADLLSATILLETSAELPVWTVRNSVVLLGNRHTLQVRGPVSVVGQLQMVQIQLISNTTCDFVLEVTGTLALEGCNMSDFTSLPIHVKGQVRISDSLFQDNNKGVFASLSLGGQLSVVRCQFLYNARSSGAVFFIFPANGTATSLFTVLNCVFEGNGKQGRSSVLDLNDRGVKTTTASHSISFSGCHFSTHPATTFRLTSSFFTLQIENSEFTNETQLITGALVNTTITQISVSQSQGPLFVLSLTEVFNLTFSNFTDIDKGPLIAITSSSISRSFLYMRSIHLANVTNLDFLTPGVLLHAQQTTIWLDTVTLANFKGNAYGIFVLVGSVLYARNISAWNSTATAGVIGIMTLSTIEMNDTSVEGLNSRGSMWIVNRSWARIRGVRYRKVQGYFESTVQVYTTNFVLLRQQSQVAIDGLDAQMAVAGTPLIYVLLSNLTVSNSVFAGPVGMSVIAIQSGRAVFSHVSLELTEARNLVMGLLEAYFEFDQLRLNGLKATSSLFTLSSGSIVYIRQLWLTNVTSIALSKGQHYQVTLGEVRIEQSNIGTLVYFGIGVNMTVDSLVMRNTTGNLFSAFSSTLCVHKAEIGNVTVPDRLFHLFNSEVSLAKTTFSNLRLGEAGSLATVLSQSTLHLTAVLLYDVSGLEQGVIVLDRSTLLVSSSSFSQLNVSLVLAQKAHISILNSEVSDILLGQEAKSLSMVPNGALLSCSDCPSILISDARCRNLQANKGGVIYAVASEGQTQPSMVVERSLFENCSARTYGGVVSAEKYNLTVVQCNFNHNTANTGGAINFQGDSQRLTISNSSFFSNSALTAGSCIRWTGLLPEIIANTYSNNSAFYGNPQASVPHHLLLLEPDTLHTVTHFPIQGVTGKLTEPPLLLGVFDVFGQLIVTDNSTLVTVSIPSSITVFGSTTVVSIQGISTFSFLLYPYSTDTLSLVFSSSSVETYTIPYQLLDCQPGETRTERGCFPCPKNSYSLNSTDTLCKSCPLHAQCYGKAALSLDPGYWRSSNYTDDILPCLVPDSCLGGQNSTCASGYNGVLCGACSEGYYHYAAWLCRDCEEALPLPARGFFSAMLLLWAVAIPPHLFLASRGLAYRLALVWRMLLNYMHMIMFVILIHAEWDLKVLIHHEVLREVGSLGALMVSAGCYNLKEPYFQSIVLACYPVLLLVFSVVWWCVALHKCGGKQGMVWAASYVALYHYLPVLCLVVVVLCQCQEVEGEKWLVTDMTQQCWTATHKIFVLTLTIPLIILVAAAHLLAVLCILKPPATPTYQAIHQYFTAGLKENWKHLELRLILRRLAFCFLSLAYPHLQPFSSSILCSCLLGSSIQTDTVRHPYMFPSLNKLSLATYLSSAAILFTIATKDEYFSLALACFGTMSVLGLGAAALLKKNEYALREKPTSTPQAVSQQSLFNLESSCVLDPPPPSCIDLLAKQ